MKNIQTIINIALGAAVIFLLVKFYSPGENRAVIRSESVPSRMVYVNSDSLMDSYKLFQDMKTEIERRRDSVDKALTATGNALQADIERYQQRAAGMSPTERQLSEEALMLRQQKFVEAREQALDKLTIQEETLNDSVHNDLIGFLKEYNKNHGYDFIFGYQRGSGILFASDSLDITSDVLKGLNK